MVEAHSVSLREITRGKRFLWASTRVWPALHSLPTQLLTWLRGWSMNGFIGRKTHRRFNCGNVAVSLVSRATSIVQCYLQVYETEMLFTVFRKGLETVRCSIYLPGLFGGKLLSQLLVLRRFHFDSSSPAAVPCRSLLSGCHCLKLGWSWLGFLLPLRHVFTMLALPAAYSSLSPSDVYHASPPYSPLTHSARISRCHPRLSVIWCPVHCFPFLPWVEISYLESLPQCCLLYRPSSACWLSRLSTVSFQRNCCLYTVLRACCSSLHTRCP